MDTDNGWEKFLRDCADQVQLSSRERASREASDLIEEDEELNREIMDAISGLPREIGGRDLVAFARRFAKWGSVHAFRGSDVPEDLRDAAHRYRMTYSSPGGAVAKHAERAFFTGAKWQSLQMLKGAADGEISGRDVGDDSYVKVLEIPGVQKAMRAFDVGDKVKVIITKED